MSVITKCQYPVLKDFIGVKSPRHWLQLLSSHIHRAVESQRVADVALALFLILLLKHALKA